MNGDEGFVSDLDNNDISVNFNNNIHIFNLDRSLNDDNANKDNPTKKKLNVGMLLKSYGVTTHRFQGSEKEYVIGYIPKSNGGSFLNSNLFYTLITRAKKNIWLVGDLETMERAAVTRPPYRCDNLALRINNLNNLN